MNKMILSLILVFSASSFAESGELMKIPAHAAKNLCVNFKQIKDYKDEAPSLVRDLNEITNYKITCGFFLTSVSVTEKDGTKRSINDYLISERWLDEHGFLDGSYDDPIDSAKYGNDIPAVDQDGDRH